MRWQLAAAVPVAVAALLAGSVAGGHRQSGDTGQVRAGASATVYTGRAFDTCTAPR